MFGGEDRILVPSPKVATYDRKPEMSAYEVTEKLEEAIAGGKYDLIVCNYANPDMVGHTGIMSAAIKAVDTIDICLGRLMAALEKSGGVMLLEPKAAEPGYPFADRLTAAPLPEPTPTLTWKTASFGSQTESVSGATPSV